jgi:NADH:ubiquinone oxidoreductase subunit E
MVEVRVCVGTSCHLNGSYNVVQDIQQMIEQYELHEKIDFEAIFCMKECQAKGVSIKVGEEAYRIEPDQVKSFFTDKVMSLIRQD